MDKIDVKYMTDYEGNIKSIIIEMPVDVLQFAQENRPYMPYVIEDTNAMSEYFAKYFLDFDEDETGDSAFFRVVDQFFDYAYEGAEDWLVDQNWE